jgi:hypothetical protein
VITAVIYLTGLIGNPRHPDMQKIRIIGFFFENRLHWQFEVGDKISAKGYIFIYTQIKH